MILNNSCGIETSLFCAIDSCVEHFKSERVSIKDASQLESMADFMVAFSPTGWGEVIVPWTTIATRYYFACKEIPGVIECMMDNLCN